MVNLFFQKISILTPRRVIKSLKGEGVSNVKFLWKCCSFHKLAAICHHSVAAVIDLGLWFVLFSQRVSGHSIKTSGL